MYIETALSLLKRANTRLVCVDVGCAGGFGPRISAISEESDIVGIDADPDECARLNSEARPGKLYVNAGVGRKNETITVKLNKKRMTSSCYETDMKRVSQFNNPERFEAETEISFTTRSLDDVCSSAGINRIDYLKVDVEGNELPVLESYSDHYLLGEFEVNFHPFRKGVPLLRRNHEVYEKPWILPD